MTITLDSFAYTAKTSDNAIDVFLDITDSKLITYTIVVNGTTGSEDTPTLYKVGEQTFSQDFTLLSRHTAEETTVELWYLFPERTNASVYAQIDNSAQYGTVTMSSFLANGSLSLLDYDGSNSVSTNPASKTYTGLATGNLMFAVIGDGAGTWAPSAQTGTDLYTVDDGNYGDSVQYYVTPNANDRAIGWTFGTSDDWTISSAVFQENQRPEIVTLNTSDAHVFTTAYPALEFTGTDTENNDLRYELNVDRAATMDSGTYIDQLDVSNKTIQKSMVTSYYYGQTFIPTESTWVRRGTMWLSRPYGGTGTITFHLQYKNNDDSHWYTIADSEPYSVENFSADWTPHMVTLDLTYVPIVKGWTYALTITRDTTDNIYLAYCENQAIHYGTPHTDYPYYDFAPADLCFKVEVAACDSVLISGTNSIFANTVTPADADPFNASEKISYTYNSPLGPGYYYWRVRSNDPTGSGVWGDWSDVYSFRVMLPLVVTAITYALSFKTLTLRRGFPLSIQKRDIVLSSQTINLLRTYLIGILKLNYVITWGDVNTNIWSASRIYVSYKMLNIYWEELNTSHRERYLQKITYID